MFLCGTSSAEAQGEAPRSSVSHDPAKPPLGVLLEIAARDERDWNRVSAAPHGGAVAMSNGNGRVLLWEAETVKAVELDSSRAACLLSFSPDGETLAALRTVFVEGTADAASTEVQLWRKSKGDWRVDKRIAVPNAKTQLSIGWSPDGRSLAATFAEPGVVVWDAESGEVVWRAPFYAYAAAFSRDARWLAAGSSSNPQLWEWPSGELVWKKGEHGPNIGSLGFVGRNDLLWAPHALPDVGRYRIAQRATAETLRVRERSGPIRISPDGGLLLMDSGTSILVRELWTRETLGSVTAPRGFLSRDGTTCGGRLVASELGKTTVWDLPALVRASLPIEARERTSTDDELWEDLASAKRGAGFLAFWTLAERGAGLVPWLKARLDAERLSAEEFSRLAEELDADRPAQREAARNRLRRAAWLMPKAMKDALENAGTVEAKAVLKGLQAELAADELAYIPNPYVRRGVRVAHLLEIAKTPEAQAILRELAESDAPDLQDAVRNILWRLPKPSAAAKDDSNAPTAKP